MIAERSAADYADQAGFSRTAAVERAPRAVTTPARRAGCDRLVTAESSAGSAAIRTDLRYPRLIRSAAIRGIRGLLVERNNAHAAAQSAC